MRSFKLGMGPFIHETKLFLFFFVVSGESNSPDRFVWLPSTKNKNVFKVFNDGQNYGTRKANKKSPKEIENDQKVLQYLFDTNNNHDDRHIK